MKRLFTCIALVAMSIGAWAWTWTGETRTAGNYYLNNVGKGSFMYVENGSPKLTSDAANATLFTINASGKTDLQYTINGTTYYLYQDAGAYGAWVDKQADPSPAHNATSFVSMGYGWDFSATGDAYFIWSNHKYTYSTGLWTTNKHEGDTDRNIYANTNTDCNCTKDNNQKKSNEAKWQLISIDQVDVYNHRNVHFLAQIGNSSVEGGAPSILVNGQSRGVSVDEQGTEISNYAARNDQSLTVTFQANPATGYNFEGWYSDADFAAEHFVDDDESYVKLLNWKEQSITLYAKYVQGAVSTVITRELTNLDWYTTYAIADLFSSNNPNPMVVTRDGVEISELTTRNESSITLKVSQAAVEDEYEAATDVEFTFAVAPATACEPVEIFSREAEGGKIEESAVDVYNWGFAADVRSISYEFKTSFASNKTIYLDQLVDGTWKNVWSSTNRPTGYTPNTVNLSANHESATALRFRMSGGGTGSMWVKNVVINGENGISVPEKRDTTLAEVNDLTNIDGGVIELGYTSVATIQYEITDVAATKGNATVVLTPQETIDNECGDFGAYHFAVMATCTERVSVITANAHFFTADGYDKVVPVKIELAKLAQTLSWDVTGAVTLFDDENLEETATATSSLDVTYSSSDEDVVKYENGAWVVVAAGEATIYADQAGNDTYEAAAQISKTITVLSRRYSKESGALAWNTMTTDPTKSMYKADGNLITTTALGKHGTICLPYDATVEGAVIYAFTKRVAEGLEFVEAGNAIEAGRAYIYFATDRNNVQTWFVDDTKPAVDVVRAESTVENLLEGTYAQITLVNSEYFLYTGGEEDCFHPAGQNVVMPAFRACIPNMPDVSDNAPIRLILPKAGVATGVENATDYKATKAMVDGKIVIVRGAKAFNVAGQAL